MNGNISHNGSKICGTEPEDIRIRNSTIYGDRKLGTSVLGNRRINLLDETYDVAKTQKGEYYNKFDFVIFVQTAQLIFLLIVE
jgi:hypothetical protein